MDIEPRSELAAILAAAADSDQEKLIARRLLAALEPTIELMILNAMSNAADRASADIAPGQVVVQLHGGRPQLVVTMPPELDPATKKPTNEPPPTMAPNPPGHGTNDGTNVARMNLRITSQLKAAVEAAAAKENLSVNAWASKALAHQAQQTSAQQTTSRPQRGRLTGWGI